MEKSLRLENSHILALVILKWTEMLLSSQETSRPNLSSSVWRGTEFLLCREGTSVEFLRGGDLTLKFAVMLGHAVCKDQLRFVFKSPSNCLDPTKCPFQHTFSYFPAIQVFPRQDLHFSSHRTLVLCNLLAPLFPHLAVFSLEWGTCPVRIWEFSMGVSPQRFTSSHGIWKYTVVKSWDLANMSYSSIDIIS